MNTVEQEAMSLVQMSVGPMVRLISTCAGPSSNQLWKRSHQSGTKNLFRISRRTFLSISWDAARLPQSLNPSNWHKAQKAERLADLALRNARVS
ncbi:hypothetical protein PILCRDRAFT_821105 [Piloderma croceum F 1598]|uniref:Uncharacterized protein n=1 Tax=Piloderma croceum (strain F 1598) TaxID=765440 RepID=A0A0C3FPW3_PILCF|nr:hypothetical protein PILCRDRAFT_821105 [Piloderma croceum F 1598]